MKTLAILLSACLAVAPVTALETHRGTVVTLTDEDATKCDDGGGCLFVTRAQLYEAIDKAAKVKAGNCMGSS